jgi:hypothetical protein
MIESIARITATVLMFLVLFIITFGFAWCGIMLSGWKDRGALFLKHYWLHYNNKNMVQVDSGISFRELNGWLITNNIKHFYDTYDLRHGEKAKIYFKRKNDLMRFKLTWL